MLRVATAFSGGLAALEWAMRYEDIEHEVVFACEWDKYARKQYLSFHGEPVSKFYEDIQDLNATPYLNQIDLFVFGSPCQDLSLAGKRKGFLGEKSSLFRHGARVLEEMLPKVFIFENVKGLLSSNGGADYKEVEKTFRDLGYHMAMKVVNAKEQGTAQNRERVFVVGFLDEDDYHDFSFADTIPLVKCLRDYLEDEVTEKYYLKDEMVDKFISSGEDCLLNEDSITKTLCCGGRGSLSSKHSFDMLKVPNKIGYINQDTQASTVFSIDGVAPGLCAGTHGYAQGYVNAPTLSQIGKIGESQADRVYDIDGCACTLKANGGGGGAKTGLYQVKSATKRGYEEATENDSINFTFPDSKTRRGRVGVAHTLDTACNQGVIESKVATNIKESVRKNFLRDYSEIIKCEKVVWYSECTSGFQDNKVCLTESACLRANNSDLFNLDREFRIRRLTPRECFRLMGMEDCDISLVNSDTQSYKIAGNGIEINTMRSIVRQLYKPVKSSLSLF